MESVSSTHGKSRSRFGQISFSFFYHFWHDIDFICLTSRIPWLLCDVPFWHVSSFAKEHENIWLPTALQPACAFAESDVRNCWNTNWIPCRAKLSRPFSAIWLKGQKHCTFLHLLGWEWSSSESKFTDVHQPSFICFVLKAFRKFKTKQGKMNVFLKLKIKLPFTMPHPCAALLIGRWAGSQSTEPQFRDGTTEHDVNWHLG